MKKISLLLVGILLLSFVGPTFASETAKSAVLIGEVTCIKRIIGGNDIIRTVRVDDPENPFVSIFFTTIKSGKVFAMADPSNTSIAARLTGKIPVGPDGNRLVNTSTNLNIAMISKSIGSKVMRIARFYDKNKDTLVYLIYTTKLLDGSLKHNLSVVPLGHPLVP